jgi:hypothetical protein
MFCCQLPVEFGEAECSADPDFVLAPVRHVCDGASFARFDIGCA